MRMEVFGRASPHSIVAVPREEMAGLVGAGKRSLVSILYCLYMVCCVTPVVASHTIVSLTSCGAEESYLPRLCPTGIPSMQGWDVEHSQVALLGWIFPRMQ